MTIKEVQNNFGFGELDPKIVSRPDFQGFYKGARKALNTLVQPRASLKKRFGLTFLTEVEDDTAGTPVTDVDKVNGVVFQFSAAKKFFIVVRPDDEGGMNEKVAFDVYLDDVLQTTDLTADYTIAQIADMYLLEAEDRIIVLHEEVQPHEYTRTADNNWTLSAIEFAYVPNFDFSNIDDPDYRGAGATFTPSATSGVGITLTASGAFYNAGHVGGLFVGGGGIFRITAVNAGGTIATGTTVQDFAATTAINGIDAILSGSVWGNFSGGTPVGTDRGWPSRGEFFNGKLVLGRTSQLKNHIAFSAPSDYYNFDESEDTDLNAFSLFIGGNSGDAITDMISSRALLVITESGIHATTLFLDTPITPSNGFLNEVDKSGSVDLRAHSIDNQVMFVDESEYKVNSAQYDLTAGTVNIVDVSMFSPHLIDSPVATDVLRPKSRGGDYFVVVNSDGTSALFQSQLNQNIAGWTPNETQGLYKKVFCKKDVGYYLVQRHVGTGATVAGSMDNVYKANRAFESFTDISAAAKTSSTDVDILEIDGDYIVIGNQAPFDRMDIDFDTASNADLDLTFEYLNEIGDWTAFTPTDATSGFTANGLISWTISTDMPDWGLLDLSLYLATGVSLPADTSVGPAKKFWIRIKRNAPGVIDVGLSTNSTFTVFTSITDSLSDTSDDVEIFSNQNDYLLLGYRDEFDTITVAFNTVASADIVPTFEYYDEDGVWQTFTPTDNTTGFTGNGTITWTASNLTGWAAGTVAGNAGKYWVRIRRTAAVVATPPIEDSIYFDITITPVEEDIAINISARLYFEKIDFDVQLDSQVSTTSDANGLVTGLTHLAGNYVFARVDDVTEGPFFVNSSGEITVSEVSSSDVEVGIKYTPVVIPMPAIARQFAAQSVYPPKFIKGVFVDVYESLNVSLNDFEIPDLSVNNFTLDQTPIPLSKFTEVTPLLGWDPRVEMVISQSTPEPFEIIGVGYRMEFS